MTCRIRLVLVIHNHQPVGNFDGVFEQAYQDSYAPFLDVLQEYPQIPFSLHLSGSLLEWLVDAHPEYIDKVRMLVDRGQVEMVGGPFFEPILAAIPRRDRIGQIEAYGRYLEQLFGSEIRGMWVPERVWEQSFASDIAQAGIEYTILDDFHFRNAGLRGDELFGYYISEDEGQLLKIFPGSERLRYTIPFADPYETVNYLREISERRPNTVVAFGDDGEKFGTWPGTKKHVYEDGWLRRFLDALSENQEWLRVATMAETIDNLSPTGRCYLPDSSYREMTEWALPPERQLELNGLTHRFEHDSAWGEVAQFVRGGFWRNFRVKYSESNEMYSRMLLVSRKLDELSQTETSREQADLLNQARTALYRSQCNCSYWHGAFGGLYLPHLRNAVYSNLIAADSFLDKAMGRPARWVQVDSEDFDLDARKEVRLAGDHLVAFLAPSRGGHLYELDVRGAKHNLLATLNRRPEAYHEKVKQGGSTAAEGQVASIHDMVLFKQPDLDRKLGYDSWPRKCLVDHFLEPGLRLEEFQAGNGELGDFVTGVFETVQRRSRDRAEARMSRIGHFAGHRIRMTKTVALSADAGHAIEILYELSELPPQITVHFGVEFNFAGMAANAPDRYFYDGNGSRLGPLESVMELDASDRIGLVDEWMGLDVTVDSSRPAPVWTFPIQTISQSEGGFELVHQSSVVMPHWQFTAPDDGRWGVQLTLSTDTSAAQARLLREASAVQ